MDQERTCTTKPAGGSTRTFLKDTNRRANWPDAPGPCTESEAQRQSGRHTTRSVEGRFLKVGAACPAVVRRTAQRIVHGADFCVVARRKQLRIFGTVLEKRFEAKQTRHIGLSAGDAKELKTLNRTSKIDVQIDEMTLEAGTKLVEGALETMKLVGAKGVDSPRVRRNEEHTAQIENTEKLTPAMSTSYRSLVLKLANVAEDRCDIAEAAKFTRHMKEPRSGHVRTQEVVFGT